MVAVPIYSRYLFAQGPRHENLTMAALNDINCNSCTNGGFRAGLYFGSRQFDMPDGLYNGWQLHDAADWTYDHNGGQDPEMTARILRERFGGSTQYESHYGSKQWWHGMWPTGETSEFTWRDKIIGLAIQNARNALEEQATAWTNYDYMGVQLGQVLHTIQDSFSRSHVVRNGDKIVQIQDYRAQSPAKHHKADQEDWSPEYKRAQRMSTRYLDLVICKKPAALGAEIRRLFERSILPFDAGGVTKGRSAPAFRPP